MVGGLILLVLLGVLVAFIFTRTRQKMKLNVSGKHWIGAIIVVIIVALILWANSHPHH